MILKRLGNKTRIAKEIIKYFPSHTTYVEPFFGAGGLFFNKPKAKYSILNDLDSDVINLFNVILNKKNEFLELLELTPYSSELFRYWTKNEEKEPLKKALRFVYLSNYGYFGMKSFPKISAYNNAKEIAIQNLKKTINFLKDCDIQFTDYDFRKAIKSVAFREQSEIDKTFFYCDPPYLGTTNNYSHSFTEQDCIDLFDTLQNTGCKFAISEFDNPFVMKQAKERGLHIYTIGDRRTLTNRQTEILITNYENQKMIFD
jgi:DNA adenine methylase